VNGRLSDLVDAGDQAQIDRRLPGDAATMTHLIYAEAVVKEAMRLRPVVPFLGFEPTRNLTLSTADGRELDLAAGTELILLLSYGGQRDTGRFPQPDEFRPQRWLEGRIPEGTLPFNPFGGGPRFCPGRNLAMMEASMVTSMLARTFDFLPDRSAGPVREGLSFAVVPKNLHLKAQPRT